MFDISFAGAALAGLLSFFTPCILPIRAVLPMLHGWASRWESCAMKGALRLVRRKRLVLSSVAFALGVTSIFVLLGMGGNRAGGRRLSLTATF